jgi:hypothetical protein
MFWADKERSIEIVRSGLDFAGVLASESNILEDSTGAMKRRYTALDNWAKEWPPESYTRRWTPQMLELWAYSGLNRAQQDDFQNETTLNKWQQRIDLLKKRYPNYSRSYALEAEFEMIRGHFEESIAANEQAITKDASLIYPYNNIAWSMLKLGRREEARTMIEDCLQKVVESGKPSLGYLQTARSIYETLLSTSRQSENPAEVNELRRRAIKIYDDIAEAYEAEATRLTTKAKTIKAQGDDDLADELRADGEAKRSIANERKKRADQIRALTGTVDGGRQAAGMNVSRQNGKLDGGQKR